MRTKAALTLLLSLSILVWPEPARAGEAGGTGVVAQVAQAAHPAADATSVSINGGAVATRDPDVTVTLPPPAGAESSLRISLDAGATWMVVAYHASLQLSLVEPAAGGSDVDGDKTVMVEAGDGAATWVSLGSDSIMLDRTAPEPPGLIPNDTGSWQISMGMWWEPDAGSGIARTEVSFDGVRWAEWPEGGIDARTMDIGGSWTPGPRTVFFRTVDRAGNASMPSSATVNVAARWEAWEIPALYQFPRPPITGELFTIRPVFQDGYRVPSGTLCQWTLIRGSDDRLDAIPDEHYGELITSRAPVNGVCTEWTFTLPWTSPRGYSWSLCVATDSRTCIRHQVLTEVTSFHAELGTTDRHVRESNIPIYYILPTDTMVATGQAVTYRLYASGGATPPTDGLFWCDAAGGIEGYFPRGRESEGQKGGTSFTCHPTTNGPWVAGWVRERGTWYWRSQYDPVSDRSRPVVNRPTVSVAPSARLGAGSQAQVSWSGRDKGTGIFRYEVQVSRNGGSYATVSLPSRLSQSLVRSVAFGATYRFRIRARDRAGNIGAWTYSAPFRAAAYQEGSSTISYAGGPWTVIHGASLAGGAARTASVGGSNATIRFSGRSISWIAPKGPDRGFGRVWVDGRLVATVDLTAVTARPSRGVWRAVWSSVATHTVRIQVLGTTGRPAIDLDAFVLLR